MVGKFSIGRKLGSRNFLSPCIQTLSLLLLFQIPCLSPLAQYVLPTLNDFETENCITMNLKELNKAFFVASCKLKYL